MKTRELKTGLRALLVLTRTSLQRLAREGSVARALAWPGLLCVGTLVAVAAVAQPGPPAPTAVTEARLAAVLLEAGLPSELVPDAEAALEQGAERSWSATPQGPRLVLAPLGWQRFSGRRAQQDLAVEAVVRAETAAAWQLVVPPPPTPDPARSQAQAALLARLIAMVCALYAVVLTVAGAVRDRENGVLEAIHTSPTPAALPSAARALAVALGCTAALLGSTLALAGLLPLPELGPRLPGLVAGVLGGTALGTWALGGTGRAARGPWSGAPPGMSQPLRAGLVAASAAGALGALWPAMGALPLASLGAPEPSALQGAAALAVAAVAQVWACRRVGAVGW